MVGQWCVFTLLQLGNAYGEWNGGIMMNETAYTSSKLSSLWSSISVSTAAQTTVAEPTAVSSQEIAPPPNMPSWSSTHTLPADFIYGWASSSYQCEGAVKDDNRGPSVWDAAAHEQKYLVYDNTNGDIAANHYYLYKQDIMRLSAIGVKYYSMSISWSRIFPFGKGSVNQAGLQHYIDEVNFLLEQGIQPIITLLQFDVPLELQNEYGGFFRPRIIEDFENYAKVVFDAFGSKVKHWITINEPFMYCKFSGSLFLSQLGEKSFASHGNKYPEAQFKCGHNTLLAHARVVKLFRETVQSKYPDRLISYKDSFYHVESISGTENDQEAAERSIEFDSKWFAKPIFVDGDYPEAMKDGLTNLLPEFTQEEKELINGSADFFAWTGFSGHLVQAASDDLKSASFKSKNTSITGYEACKMDFTHESWPSCSNMSTEDMNGWPVGTVGDISTPRRYSTPELFRNGIRFINDQFKPREGILIAEFGFPVKNESKMPVLEAIYDSTRVDYYRDYLDQLLKIVNEDKIRIIGAFAWSAFDQFECIGGMQSRFGLQHVDFATQKRTFKRSAHIFMDFFKHHVQGSGNNGNETNGDFN